MLVPQGMAYALLAGMPAVSGLIAATLPIAAYALTGTSRALAVGPVAIVSLLTFEALSRLATPGSAEYIALAGALALMVGAVQGGLGLLRGGVVVHFLSHAVVAGFTSAAALVIALAQLRHLLGVPLQGGQPLALLQDAGRQLDAINPSALLLGLGAIALLMLLRRLHRRLPGALVVVVLGGLLVALTGLPVATIGAVPGGLPSFSWPALSLEQALALVPAALTIAFIGFTESIAVARALAAPTREHIQPNRELIGLGLANLSAGLLATFPVTGGFSRSAVNAQAGARSPLAGVVSALLVLATLLYLTPLFAHLPQAVLAAIVMVAVAGLIDLNAPRRLWRLRPSDAVLWGLTFAATLLIGVEAGLLGGAAVALATLLVRSAFPHVARLGYLAQERVWRNRLRYPEARQPQGIEVLRFDAPLYFANTGFLRDRVEEIVGEAGLEGLILDLSNAYDIDAVGVETLHEILVDLEARGKKVAVAGLKGPVRDVIERADWRPERRAQIAHMAVEHALAGWGIDAARPVD